MADYACRCVPANQSSISRALAVQNSNINGIAERVTELETTTADHETRISSLESVSESPFIVVDNETELDAALETGKKILLRGEGNGGEIEITSRKDVSIPGTAIYGYGYKPGSSDYYGRLKANFPTLEAYGATFAPYLFNLETDNLEFGGFEIEGRDDADIGDLVSTSYIAFSINAGLDLSRIYIHDIYAKNLNRFISKWGYIGCGITREMFVERCKIENLTGFGVSIQESLYDSVFRDNVFLVRQDGAAATHANAQGMWISSDIRDCTIDNNKVRNPVRMGIEMMSNQGSPGVARPMDRINIINNRVTNCGSFGISLAYAFGSKIRGNYIDGAVGIGIESSNGAHGENSGTHRNEIIDNDVLNVTSSTFATGIALDKGFGDIAALNRISNISSSFSGASQHAYSRGLLIYQCRQARVWNNDFRSVNGCSVFLQPNTVAVADMQAVIEGNAFRTEGTDTKAVYAVLIQGGIAVVRNNTAFEPVSGLSQQRFGVQFNGGAPVYAGQAYTAPVVTDGVFLDSNLVIQY